ncbi:MAG: hypothetical protein E6K78_03725 [Candidatus Eisenbacteria bacterium]|uniref:Uncharacterized protein n=1 Tax=Eiseniibacteriota bacterium TaxID=2212470 RepID=A0A538TVZ6_UNCEI|nr:MAG: hypothetical protein E6K78_03725 [Candidatus Eisenbacteria bacterium]
MPLLMLALLALAAPGADRALYDRLCERTAAAYDSARGGFVQDGVPSEAAVELGLLRGREPGVSEWSKRSLTTIAWTRGLRDTVGGGFLHGASDDPRGSWPLKRADSNSRRLENLLLAWRVTSESSYRVEAARVADYMDRVLLDGRGGFLAEQTQADLVPDANGYAIHAWLMWAAASLDLGKRDFALRSLDRVWETCWIPDVGLVRRDAFGEASPRAELLDQVEMGRAFLLAARLVGRDSDATRARTLGDIVLGHFADPERGGFSAQWATTKTGKVKREKPLAVENARAALFLCELSTLTGQARYRDGARGAWTSFTKRFPKSDLVAADWAIAVRAAIEPSLPSRPQWPKPAAPALARRSMTFHTGKR